MIDWLIVADMCGCTVQDIPQDLVAILDDLDMKIRDAKLVSINCGYSDLIADQCGLRSSQVIGLVVLLWQLGIFEGKTE